MNSTKLLQFKAIADYQSITGAAAHLFVSQSALSKSLSSLEKELNCKLFLRSGRKLYLNERGKQLLDYVNQLDMILNQIQDTFMIDSQRNIRVGSISSSVYMLWSNYIKQTTKQIHFETTTGLTIANRLLQGEIDAAIADESHFMGVFSNELVKIPLFLESLYLVVPAQHELADRDGISFDQIKNTKFFRNTDDIGTNEWISRLCNLNGKTINWALSLDSGVYQALQKNYRNMYPYFDSLGLDVYNTYPEWGKTGRYVQVLGEHTQRMLYLWYLQKNELYLDDFIHSYQFCRH